MDRPDEPARDPASLDDRVVAVFAAVVDLPPADRPRALTELCGDDDALRTAVDALLAEHDAPPPILSRLVDEAARRRDPTQAPGTMVGPFRILERIGQGGMGIVYRALQDRPRRTVALKVLSAGRGDGEQVSRFEREIEVLGRLQHPGICQILGAGTADLGPGLDRTQWFAMELVDGPPLVQFANDNHLDVDARCLLLANVADAIQHAHERGVVHRDLKPSNVLVARDDQGAPIAKVLDFGIAHAVADDDAAAMRTRTGMLLGTIDYMSPEQLNGGPQRPDARSDVYSLGVVLYALLAGRLPHDLAGRTLTEVCRIVADRPAPPLSRSDRRLAGDLETIVQKAMAKDAADRFASAADFAADLRRHVRREPVLARRPTAIYQLKKFAQRNRGTVTAVGATMALLAIGLVWVSVLAARNDALATSEQGARKSAEAAGRQLRASLYRSQMRLGTEAMFAAGGVARARQIAAEWIPKAGDEDLRGFEWRLLWASCHDEAAVWPSLPAPARMRWLDGDRWFVWHQVEARCIDATSGRVLREYVSSVKPVAPSTISADGRWFAHVTAHGEVTVREFASGTTRTKFTSPTAIENMVLSNDGAVCAVFAPPAGIAIHDCATGAELAHLGAAMGPMTFSDDGSRFAMVHATTGTHYVAVFRTDDWKQSPRELTCGEAGVIDLAFDRAGARIASSSYDGRLRVHALERGALLLDASHPDSLRGVALSPDGTRVAAGCRDYAIYVHDLDGGAVRALRGHEGIPSTVAWSHDGKQLVSAGDDETLRVWDLSAPQVRRERRWPTAYAIEHAQLAWSADGCELALRAAPQFAARWNVDADRVEDGFATAAGRTAIATDREGKSIRFGDEAPLPSPQPFRFLIASRDGRSAVAAAGRDGPLLRWQEGDATPHERASAGDVRGIDWLDDGRLVLVDGTDSIRVLDGRDLGELAVQPVQQCTLALAVPPTGDTIAVGCVDQTVRLWSPSRGFGAVLRGHTGHVQALAFSPDGRRLASGSRDRGVRIWDMVAAAEVAVLPLGGQPVAIAWSPDGSRLGVLQQDGLAVVFDARRGIGR